MIVYKKMKAPKKRQGKREKGRSEGDRQKGGLLPIYAMNSLAT